MASTVKDVLLIGYGAVGAIYAHVLTRGGLARVTVVARSNYEIAKDQGMAIQSKKYGNCVGWKPYRLLNSVASAADRPYSYVILTTKATPDVTKTSELLAPLLDASYVSAHSQPSYVLLQNGLNVERELYDTALDKLGTAPSVIAAAVWIATNLLEPNVVEHGTFDRVSLGIYRPDDYTTTTHTPSEAALLEDLKTLFVSGGTEITVAPEIQRLKFSKNLWNLSFSSIATLTGYTLPSLYRAPPPTGLEYEPYLGEKTADLVKEYTVPIIKAVMLEAMSVARAIGYPNSPEGIPDSLVDETISLTAGLHVSPESNHRPSMLLDSMNGLPIEVEAIVGEVVRMAKKYNVAVPRIEMIYALLLVKQNQTLRKLGKR